MAQFGGGQSYSWCPVDGSLWDEERKDEYIDMIVQVYLYRFWLCIEGWLLLSVVIVCSNQPCTNQPSNTHNKLGWEPQIMLTRPQPFTDSILTTILTYFNIYTNTQNQCPDPLSPLLSAVVPNTMVCIERCICGKPVSCTGRLWPGWP